MGYRLGPLWIGLLCIVHPMGTPSDCVEGFDALIPFLSDTFLILTVYAVLAFLWDPWLLVLVVIDGLWCYSIHLAVMLRSSGKDKQNPYTVY